ncbi:Rab-like protein 6 [Apophysomyces ossiformis]|uniref:Rab-like protein 6 n=1 Tax=Apophysomyces ossiformis TaxID=679940 RepID=A0A8H7BUA4_9FUNG|nr:Rab-like protein 6 [Apophysomyces ossiformis]
MSTAFRRGVQYNMKVIIRGDVMTGKSVLFNRLQGAAFEPSYGSTPEIQVANIPWQYKDSNDVVKIEVWDVVDKAHNNPSKKGDVGIKLEHKATTPSEEKNSDQLESLDQLEESSLALDASTVNVYRNTHAVLFLFDVTKQWTFDYVNNEIEKVPENVSVLVLGNFCDKSERVVNLDTIHATLYEHNKRRIEKGAIKPNLLRYAEISLKTGMGLKYIYEYLGMETLRKQLELKATEIVDLLENLDTDEDVPEIMQRRRGQDNFDQPSEPHLAKQHDEMKLAWDTDLQNIAAEYSAPIELPAPPVIENRTPSPPTAPIKVKKQEGPLISNIERAPAAMDQFDAGTLEDDWFGDDNSKGPLQLSLPAPSKEESDSEEPRNPMVAGDEDVESVEYFGEEVRTSISAVRTHEVETEETSDITEKMQVYRSKLDDMRGAGNGVVQPAGEAIVSDSEDEDNRVRFDETDLNWGFTTDVIQVDSPSYGFGGYEEIGGGGSNPWALGHERTEIVDSYFGKNEEAEVGE